MLTPEQYEYLTSSSCAGWSTGEEPSRPPPTSPPYPCTFSISPAPPGHIFDEIMPTIHSAEGEMRMILFDEIGECGEGWRFLSVREGELCPDSCERLQDGVSRLQLLYGCAPAEL